MKTIMIKTKNILKIGVFSIVILSLLISPVLKSNILEVNANGLIEEQRKDIKEYTAILNEGSAVDICDIAFPGGKNKWAIFTSDSDEVVQHAFCVFQIGAIEGLGKMFNATINWGIAMTLWAIEPATFGGFVTNKGVTDVGKIIRDFINLFLILGLVFIAIATILGIKKYSWQQTLWKLIVVALLVNFSVIISGMILDVSQFFTYNFLKLAKANNDISVAIKSGFNASSTMDSLAHYCLFSEECAGVTVSGGGGSAGAFANGPITSASSTVAVKYGWGLSWGNFLITTFGMILIGLFAVIALLAVFVAMMLRACLLIILLCLSPIAFAAWIFPDTEKYWKMWWDQFIKWCTFPVIFSLMLFMGITVMDALFKGIGSGEFAKMGMIAFGIQMFLFSMFLVAGLIISVQGGGAVAQFVTKQTSKLGLALGSAVGGAVVGGIQRSDTYKNVGQKLTQTVFSPIGYKMLDQSSSARFTKLKEYEKRMEEENQDFVMNIANGITPSKLQRDSYARHMAAVKVAIRKGWIKNDDKAAIDFIGNNLDDSGFNTKEILIALPQFFKRIGNKLIAITGAGDAQADEMLTTLKNMSATDIAKNNKREQIFEQLKAKGANLNRFIRNITKGLTASQQTAFYGNFDSGYWNTNGMGGVGGVIDNAVKGYSEEEIQQTQINQSPSLREVLNKPIERRPEPPHPKATWSFTEKCWIVPNATGGIGTPHGSRPVGAQYWDTATDSYQPYP